MTASQPESALLTRAAGASAPVRLDLAGGWTDVPPFSMKEGGLVVAAAIDLRVTVEVRPAPRCTTIVAEDLGLTREYPTVLGVADASELPLHRAALRSFGAEPSLLHTRSGAPPGAGLGSSGALGTALASALGAACGEPLMPLDAAERAWRIETLEAGNPGGRQDQYMAALGGFQRLEFRDPAVAARELPLDPAFARALSDAIVLCYTGASRLSGRTIRRVMDGYERGDAGVRAALSGLRHVAEQMTEALETGDLARTARLLSENWRHQQALDPAMRTPEMARLEGLAFAAGALGGKAAGSGAGGCMFFVAPGRTDQVVAAAQREGHRVLPVRWAAAGVRTW